MLTEILIQEAGSVIDYDVKAVNHERGEIKKKMSQVDYNTNRANAKKAYREGLIKELKAAREELLKAAQDECKKETTGAVISTWIRSETTQLLESSTSLVKIHYLHPGLEPEKILMSLLYMKVSYNRLLRKLETN